MPSWPQIVHGRKARLPKQWSQWAWVLTTTVGARGVMTRMSATISRAWRSDARESTIRTPVSPTMTPMF